MTTKIETEQKFDCVSFVRKERDRIAEEVEGKTPKEVIEYFRKRKTQANKS